MDKRARMVALIGFVLGNLLLYFLFLHNFVRILGLSGLGSLYSVLKETYGLNDLGVLLAVLTLEMVLLCIVFFVTGFFEPSWFGKALGALLGSIVSASIFMFVGQHTLWFPPNISEHGGKIDAQFMRTLWVVGIAFTAAQLALGYAVWRFGRKGNERAVYTHGSNKLEATWTIITASIFIAVAILGQQVWAQLHLRDAAPDAVKVNLMAQQFQFNFHYSGLDATFGKTAPEFFDDGSQNYVGLDPSDPAGKDDLQLTTLVVSADRPVELTLRSKDVIHSFFVPACRIKQDTVPGMAIKIHFTPNTPGKYEIPCAELCGNGHYKMKSFMLVVAKDDYDAMEKMTKPQFRARMDELLKRYQ